MTTTMNLADEHLTYVQSAPMRSSDAAYDVYGPAPGLQLGWVIRRGATWTAISGDPMVADLHADARWRAAIAMWRDPVHAS